MNMVLPDGGTFVGRLWRPGRGPCVVVLRDGALVDITCREVPTVRDLLERDDTVAFARDAQGEQVVILDPAADGDSGQPTFLAPCDLQAVKAAGVTFAESMVERVIEEQAAGDPGRAADIRARVAQVIGDSLSGLVPGSDQAAEVKRVLQGEGLWSQYLEVGIGPDAEVFTKCQPMAAVGHGAEIGLHPKSRWNNPEPEVVLAVTSRGEIKGATLGNDVNLRDFEGRSALLLSKAKDNNASCAIGPMLRLFDETYGLDDVRDAEVTLRVEGPDGFELDGVSSMRKISRDPADIVAQTIGRHHQYPDGFLLFLGTLFAPTQDRDAPSAGFTHKVGDVVTISEDRLGSLRNIVRLSTEAPEWTFGTGALMRNLSGRGLL
ncbi:Fumarylacetoacetate (FAA) hydrolase family protein [Palleronia marisminoris]|uniref:Fumarylacetoacetate (FAA) hydrolase family protein n=1 Tax=Palleronia marisminoris TaxID=315423 RepID=A0A1Y5TP51_9RHOB|nr:fumarylacetoacetate hydrolase family protein [Palleronia marisminoris]SFH47375.1 Fumarylacetoacetate (FAA) hydrolase family protein [Palleronia marisminoris]SLN68680.1 Fumarylacetoacetate (FAA) hydrolase family protein [Palleronia marisminoris]